MARKRNRQGIDIRKVILFVLMILCVYFILALFGSSFVGDTGREWGVYLRVAWGGAVLVPLLFWLYLCVAKFLNFSVPYLPRQILGTLQLYISFAFMLGLLHETGWDSEATLFLPGRFGQGLAHFFVLNVGIFITFILVVMSFILSAFFFGSRILRATFPNFTDSPEPEAKRETPRRSRRRVREAAQLQYPEDRPENILFMKDLPAPHLRDDPDSAQLAMTRPTFDDFPQPRLKPDPVEEPDEDFDDEEFYDEKEFEDEKVNEKLTDLKEKENYAIEIIDNLLASIDSGALSMPERKRPQRNTAERARKIRRPLPVVVFDGEFDNIAADPASTSGADSGDRGFPPPLELFGPTSKFEPPKENPKNFEKTGKAIIATLKEFSVSATIADILVGPSVVQYLLDLAPGVKVSKVAGLANELAMSLASVSVRIEAPIPGTHYAGVELPNPDRKKISLRSVLESDEFQNTTARLPLPLGVQFDGKMLIKPLENLPHLLVAGGLGSGKNTFLNASILSMCSRRRPEELKLVLIDPKHVEFAVYDGLPHLLTPPVFNCEEALKALQWAFNEMETRTANFARNRVRTLAAYNRKLPRKDRLPEVVIIINELSDLMYQAGNEIEDLIVRLAQKSGVAGIYMIIASTRPSADVVTTLIRSNISARVAFALASGAESKNIIGIADAEKLTGKGDMLFRDSTSQRIFRLQSPFINEEKVLEFVEYMESSLS